MKKSTIFSLLLLFILGCVSKPSQAYKAIHNESDQELANKAEAIDITELIEQDDDVKVAEFKEGQWVIAVRSERTGYTYYYDANNKLLGRRSEFSGNPRRELIQQRLKQGK